MKNKNIKNTQKQSPVLSFSIIIPNYNGSEFLDDCLYSLFQSIKQCSGNFEIIIIDNNSQDKSLDIAKNFFKQYRSSKISAKIIPLKRNIGFAGAINTGIDQAKYKYIVPCNNDLTLEKNWFQIISQTIISNTNSKITTFFGTVLNKEGSKYESQGLKFFVRGKCQNISNNKIFSEKEHKKLKPKLVWGASASLVVYQKDIIQKIGGFDDDFFAYEEDVDIALRLANLGYKTLYIPTAISYHLGGGTSNKMGNFRSRMDAKNWIYLILKNYSVKDFLTNFPKIFEERLRNLSGLVKATTKTYHFKSVYLLPKDILKTYGEILTNLPKILKKRKQLQKLLKSTKD